MCSSAHEATALTDLLPMLAGGDRRSIGQANRAAAIALAQPGAMAVRLPLSAPELERVWHILLGYTHDRSRIVQTTAMQALADLASAHPHLEPQARAHIATMMESGQPAVQARGRKLLAARSKPGKDSSAP